MIVVDTNVFSEPIKPHPDRLVMRWLDEQDIDTLYLTTVNVAEVLYGLELLPEGKRKKALKKSISNLLESRIGNRILAFDDAAARTYVGLAAAANKRGKAISFADGQIAAIAVLHGFAVATRDAAPFEAMGVRVINPWGVRPRQAKR